MSAHTCVICYCNLIAAWQASPSGIYVLTNMYIYAAAAAVSSPVSILALPEDISVCGGNGLQGQCIIDDDVKPIFELSAMIAAEQDEFLDTFDMIFLTAGAAGGSSDAFEDLMSLESPLSSLTPPPEDHDLVDSISKFMGEHSNGVTPAIFSMPCSTRVLPQEDDDIMCELSSSHERTNQSGIEEITNCAIRSAGRGEYAFNCLDNEATKTDSHISKDGDTASTKEKAPLIMTNGPFKEREIWGVSSKRRLGVAHDQLTSGPTVSTWRSNIS
ncbi:hypothetical protein L7F22_031871 [Adiantum nelumboides]|nr:hypothetical protein [Adiantum nelumboides]